MSWAVAAGGNMPSECIPDRYILNDLFLSSRRLFDWAHSVIRTVTDSS